ncbi:hypothetical protein CB1_000160016 [Camelus ferus]|nr:hypothetical protein CB1_000160016 [Camelus ferus]
MCLGNWVFSRVSKSLQCADECCESPRVLPKTGREILRLGPGESVQRVSERRTCFGSGTRPALASRPILGKAAAAAAARYVQATATSGPGLAGTPLTVGARVLVKMCRDTPAVSCLSVLMPPLHL